MKGLFALAIIPVLVSLPVLAYPDVRVKMTNGREIIADTCEQEGSRLVCTKMGGTFDIDKKDVISVKEIKGMRQESLPSEKAAPSAEPEKKMDNTSADKSQGKVMEIPPPGSQSEAMKRLEEIAQRKRELSSEREKLVKEREQLDEDFKKAPDWMTTDKYEDLNKRNAQLTEKIKLFNEEAGRLNDEEKRIVESLKGKD